MAHDHSHSHASHDHAHAEHSLGEEPGTAVMIAVTVGILFLIGLVWLALHTG